MGIHVANKVVKLMIHKGHTIKGAKVLVLGITFKENCPDIRNSRVIDVIKELNEFGCHVDVYDPWADPEEVKREYGIDMLNTLDEALDNYDGIVLAVAHDQFKEMAIEKNDRQIVYDIKGILERSKVDDRL
jgi:UDP-N-acetyl-D-galactosamine dehydrogenase